MKLRVVLVALTLLLAGAPAAVASPATVAPDDVKSRLTTECGQAWFWSGTVKKGKDTISVKEIAEGMANKNGGITLGQKLAQQKIKEPNDLKGWALYSKYFAEGAKCEVRAVLGQLRSGNIWEKTELPTLKKNKSITYIWRVGPLSRQACVHWRAEGQKPKNCYQIP